MNRDDIIEMALEAGFYGDEISSAEESFVHFAALVAAAEREAWRNAALRVGEDLCSVGPFGYYDMTAQQWLDWALSVVTVHNPQPVQAPLTEEEIDKLFGAVADVPRVHWLRQALNIRARGDDE